jgi:hypothetical protein
MMIYNVFPLTPVRENLSAYGGKNGGRVLECASLLALSGAEACFSPILPVLQGETKGGWWTLSSRTTLCYPASRLFGTGSRLVPCLRRDDTGKTRVTF